MEWITGNLNSLIAAGIGGVVLFCADRILYFIILNLYPATFFQGVANDINKTLENLKKKYPTAGKVAEDKIIASLNEAVKIIES